MFDFLGKYMFMTPDFGHSDLWHFNFALKSFLANSLKSGIIPLWAKDIGMGFPVGAEGQIGAFNIINLILFKFFPPPVAFNLGYLSIIVTLVIGSYLYGRAINLSKISSVFLAVIFSFSGYFVVQHTHFNLIQAASFLPWEFFLAEKILTSPKWRYIISLTLIISQQVCAGFQQITLISLISLSIYVLVSAISRGIPRRIFLIVFSSLLGLLLAFPQLLLTYQLTKLSYRDVGTTAAELIKYPYTPLHLIKFIHPYILGNPRVGTYPAFSPNWGIFWESTGYIGLIPLILLATMLLHSRHSKQPAPFSTLIVGLISLVLMLGKFTPFFIIFQVPPLSFFRVPSRFILTFVWSLVILSAYGFETIKNTKANKIILVSAIINLVVFAANYPAIVPSTTWLQQPETVQFLKKDVSWFRIYSLTPHEEWNSIFTKFGWSDANQYLFFRNSLDPNQNLIWGVPSVGLYTALSTRRSQEWNALIQKGITVNSETNEINLSSNSAKLLALGGVKYLISSSNKLKFPSPNFREAFRATGNPTFYVYTTEYFTPHVYLADSYFLVHNITELLQAVDNPEVKIPVLERNLGSEFSSTASSRICQQCGSATVEINDNHYIKIALHGITRKTLLVLTDSYYPGWKAWADSKPTTILPVDLNQRAVVIPPNTREVIFQYKPLEIF